MYPLVFSESIPKTSELYHRILAQEGTTRNLQKQAKTFFQRYPMVFSKHKKFDEIQDSVVAP